MNRRSFLTTSLAGASALAVTGLPFDAFAADQTVAERFAAARRSNPRLVGFDNAPGELDLQRVQMEGRLPAGLRGTFYRNGPGQHERGGQRYHHWFDGDGLIHRWQIGEGQMAIAASLLTPQSDGQRLPQGSSYTPLAVAALRALRLSPAQTRSMWPIHPSCQLMVNFGRSGKVVVRPQWMPER